MSLDDFTTSQKVFLVGLALGIFLGAVLSGLEGTEVTPVG
jgi:hypothetical protein